MAIKSKSRDEEAQHLTAAEDFEYRDGEDDEDHEALPSSTGAHYLGTGGEGTNSTCVTTPIHDKGGVHTCSTLIYVLALVCNVQHNSTQFAQTFWSLLCDSQACKIALPPTGVRAAAGRREPHIVQPILYRVLLGDDWSESHHCHFQPA